MAMATTAQGIEARVRDLALDVVARNGYELVDVSGEAPWNELRAS